jgi:hypothetical protein
MDFDFEYDGIQYHTPRRSQTKYTRYTPHKKKVSTYSTKPIRSWSTLQKCRFLEDDRHLFIDSYDCYWCGSCPGSWRKCSNCTTESDLDIINLSSSSDEEENRYITLFRLLMNKYI